MLKNCLLIASLVGSVFAADVKMNLNERESANHFHTKGSEKFASLVKDYTKGSVDITVHSGSSLIKGNPLKAVKD